MGAAAASRPPDDGHISPRAGAHSHSFLSCSTSSDEANDPAYVDLAIQKKARGKPTDDAQFREELVSRGILAKGDKDGKFVQVKSPYDVWGDAAVPFEK